MWVFQQPLKGGQYALFFRFGLLKLFVLLEQYFFSNLMWIMLL